MSSNISASTAQRPEQHPMDMENGNDLSQQDAKGATVPENAIVLDGYSHINENDNDRPNMQTFKTIDSSDVLLVESVAHSSDSIKPKLVSIKSDAVILVRNSNSINMGKMEEADGTKPNKSALPKRTSMIVQTFRVTLVLLFLIAAAVNATTIGYYNGGIKSNTRDLPTMGRNILIAAIFLVLVIGAFQLHATWHGYGSVQQRKQEEKQEKRSQEQPNQPMPNRQKEQAALKFQLRKYNTELQMLSNELAGAVGTGKVASNASESTWILGVKQEKLQDLKLKMAQLLSQIDSLESEVEEQKKHPQKQPNESMPQEIIHPGVYVHGNVNGDAKKPLRLSRLKMWVLSWPFMRSLIAISLNEKYHMYMAVAMFFVPIITTLALGQFGAVQVLLAILVGLAMGVERNGAATFDVSRVFLDAAFLGTFSLALSNATESDSEGRLSVFDPAYLLALHAGSISLLTSFVYIVYGSYLLLTFPGQSTRNVVVLQSEMGFAYHFRLVGEIALIVTRAVAYAGDLVVGIVLCYGCIGMEDKAIYLLLVLRVAVNTMFDLPMLVFHWTKLSMSRGRKTVGVAIMAAFVAFVWYMSQVAIDHYSEGVALPQPEPIPASPTQFPTAYPSLAPSFTPTFAPSEQPTQSPTKRPTKSPTKSPTESPSASPTASPSASPSKEPTINTAAPSQIILGGDDEPTQRPTVGMNEITESPIAQPTSQPSKRPTTTPPTPCTGLACINLTSAPTKAPNTPQPTVPPPTRSPIGANETSTPTFQPTLFPTFEPTMKPSFLVDFGAICSPEFDDFSSGELDSSQTATAFVLLQIFLVAGAVGTRGFRFLANSGADLNLEQMQGP